MRISDDVKIIREILNLSQEELAEKINIPYEVINNWERKGIVPEDKSIDILYSFAFEAKLYINNIHEQMLIDEYSHDDNIVLFHGSKNKIIDKLDLKHSKNNNDFGVGFYLGESFKQAATYISNDKSHYIYCYSLNTKDLNILKFDVSEEWMFAIAYYRGWIDEYKDNKMIKDIINKVEEADVIIAPIADNNMFNLIGEFVSGMITNMQCKHALSATNLGYQYVIKNEKILARLNLLDELFLCNEEKKYYIDVRREANDIGFNKVKVVRIEYKNKGKYIEEILK